MVDRLRLRPSATGASADPATCSPSRRSSVVMCKRSRRPAHQPAMLALIGTCCCSRCTQICWERWPPRNGRPHRSGRA